jgi:G3E family GTPase
MSTSVHPIPLVVVGGYLGAGKTTILNRLLANAGGRRIAVLVNDFGEINIDAALVRARSDDVIQLENGCICCSIGGRLADALVAIAQRPHPPDLLVIEASGVSDPQRIAQIGLLDPAFRLNGVVVAVDATSVDESLRDPLVGDMVRRQIGGASVVVLTKGDLAAPRDLAAAADTVARLSPRATVLAASHGDVPWDVFADPAPVPAAPRLLDGTGWRPAGDGVHAAIRTFAYRSNRPFDKPRLRQALKDLPVRLLRAKGLVRLAGQAGLHEVHVVGGRLRIGPWPHDGGDESALVFLGPFGEAAEAVVRATLDAATA